MGYFPNGTEGEIWEDKNCEGCVHNGAEEGRECPVMLVHGLYNYDQQDDHNLGMVLGSLIPRNGKGGNQECAMRHVGGRGTRDKLKGLAKDWKARGEHEYSEFLRQDMSKAEGIMLGRSATYARCVVELEVVISELVRWEVPSG